METVDAVWSPELVFVKLATAPFANIALLIAPLVIAVAFPIEVTTPVKFAFVTTVVAFPSEVTIPVKFAFVITLPAVKPAAVPVMFVPTMALGVPRFSAVNVGLTNVLLVNISVPSKVASVPDAGKVTFVGPVLLRVVLKAPVVSKFPPRVMVLPVLFLPVPPLAPETIPVILVAVPLTFPVRSPVTFPVKLPSNSLAFKVPVEGTYFKLVLLDLMG